MNDSHQIRKDTRQFYNNVADKFSQTRRHWWEELNFIRKYLKRKDILLDFGCGNGRFLEFLRAGQLEQENSQIRYLGVDISENLIKHAKKKYPEEEFKVIERESFLPVRDASIDVVTAIAVFHHFNPAMAKDTLGELHRVLKKEGILVITSWYLWDQQYLGFLIKSLLQGNLSLGAKVSFKDNNKETFYRYCYWWTKESLEKLARKNSFEILESGYTFDKQSRKRNIYFILKKA